MSEFQDELFLRLGLLVSTTSLVLAKLMPFAKPWTASTEPWKVPGATGLSTSAITAMRIFGLPRASYKTRGTASRYRAP